MESFGQLLVLLLVIATPIFLIKFILKITRKSNQANLKKAQAEFDKLPYSNHCMACGNDFKTLPGPRRGSGFTEAALWIMIFPAGIVYSVWRRQKSGKITCIVCKSDAVIPADSPAAKAHTAAIANAMRAKTITT
jgi:hypothetical protein